MRLPRGVLLVGVAIWGLVIAAPRAYADTPIQTATAALDASDYTTAAETVNTALDGGGNSPEDTAELFRLRGIIAAALGDAQASYDAFVRCLALNPKASLPVGTSPKIMRPFDTAKRYFLDHPTLKVKVTTEAKPPSVTLVVESDSLAMVAKARVTFVVDGAPEQTREGTGKIDLPDGARLDVRVAVLDDKGNRLVELGSADVPIVIIGGGKVVTKKAPDKRTPDVDDEPRSPRPLYLKWWVWGGAALVAGGLTTWAGVSAVSAKNELDDIGRNSRDYTFDQARDVEDRARRNVLFTNIGFGVTAGLAIGATILYLTAPSQPTAERATMSIAPVPVRGGGALVLEGAF